MSKNVAFSGKMKKTFYITTKKKSVYLAMINIALAINFLKFYLMQQQFGVNKTKIPQTTGK